MTKQKNLTRDIAETRINNILDNMNLPCDTADALVIIAKLANDYQVWKKENSIFIKNNKESAKKCEKQLKSVINGYKDVKKAMAKSKKLAEDCATDGPIWDMMQEVSQRLMYFQGYFCGTLERAESFISKASIEK